MTTSKPRSLDPRDLIRAVLLWALLFPLALLAFLAGVIVQNDTVYLVNALVYALGAALAFSVARQAGIKPLARISWSAAGGLCVVLVLSKLGGAVIGHFTASLAPNWLGDLVCWVSAGLLFLAIAWLRPRATAGHGAILATTPVLGLFGIGFALLSVALGLDIGEPHLRYHFGISVRTYGNLTGFIEFGFLQLYLLGFICLAAELTARHALLAQIARAEETQDPAASLRAAQLAFTIAAFCNEKFSTRRRRRALTGLIAGTGLGGWVNAAKLTRRLGPSIGQRTGKSLLRQFGEQIRLVMRYGMTPKYYYQFELFDPARAREAGSYLQRSETKATAYKIMHHPTGRRTSVSEKLEFHEACRAFGLSVAPVVFATASGAPDEIFANRRDLPAADLFIKPRKGSGGRGAAKWKFVPAEGDGVPYYTHSDGRKLTAAALIDLVVEQSRDENVLVQTTLENHPDLAGVNCGALATCRIVTCRNEDGGYEVTDAAFRMPRKHGSPVDNFHAGGIAAAVDIATGRLGPATDLGLSPHSAWFTSHPATGAQIEGRLLPRWRDACALVERAHPHFSDFAVIGWDVAILPDGPCIIEANGAPDLDIIQRTSRRPLGAARLGRLMAWHVRRDLRHALLG